MDLKNYTWVSYTTTLSTAGTTATFFPCKEKTLCSTVGDTTHAPASWGATQTAPSPL